MWPQNIRVTLNYLGRLTCVSGNLTLMLAQAKRIMTYLSHYQVRPIVTELIKDLQVRTYVHVLEITYACIQSQWLLVHFVCSFYV